jgi:hypothetical protein
MNRDIDGVKCSVLKGGSAAQTSDISRNAYLASPSTAVETLWILFQLSDELDSWNGWKGVQSVHQPVGIYMSFFHMGSAFCSFSTFSKRLRPNNVILCFSDISFKLRALSNSKSVN